MTDSEKIDLEENNLKHLAIIMDGNGRWAKKYNMPTSLGHKKGAENAKTIITHVAELNIPYLTLYAFSCENWNRPKDEVEYMMELFLSYLQDNLDELHKNNIKFKLIGEKHKLPQTLQSEITYAEYLTQNNTGLFLNIAISYGGRQELIYAVKSIAEELASGNIQLEQIDEMLISSHLYTNLIPDPDFIIRTSGEERLSNFLLWQSAYSELYFSPIYWPDFTKDDLNKALCNYKQRRRNYGKRQVLTENE